MPVAKLKQVSRDSRIQLLVILAILVAAPFWAPNLWFVRILIIANLFAVYALSWNLLVGYTGQISFGHAFFFGGGAYASVVLNKYLGFPVPLAMSASAVMCGLAGLLLGYPCLRVRGIYLALMTWAFPLILIGFVMYFGEIFGREMGISGFDGLWASYNANYYGSLILIILSVCLKMGIVNSRFGVIIRGIRDNEILAESVGVHVSKYKVMIFALSGLVAGISGAFYAHFLKCITPELLEVDMSILVIIMVIVGGLGSTIGPIMGAYLVIFLNNYLLYISELRMMIYAIVLIVILFLRPQGLLPWTPKLGVRRTG
ncbi:MAG: branched-chain amino acid ABC transporter permease [Desulfobacteraceae bacterium]|nr:branched-chain amino acid ABC transporter permease [Desulfobacteraceae bacterium]